MNMRYLIVLLLIFPLQASAVEAFISYCKYEDSILGIMYPQKTGSSTYYLFELKDGEYVDLGSGDAGGDYFQSGIAANREEGEALLARSKHLVSYFKGKAFKLVSLPDDHTKIKLEATNVCAIP
ncbi:hypothetical protein ACJJI3_09590 [Microbulbifer sp. ZKSA004]|uniref:hypothetical protein n=1 Tax=Microbulbifer sp. ZKSA004 TaxID=3243389 RepID=UPI00403A105B